MSQVSVQATEEPNSLNPAFMDLSHGHSHAGKEKGLPQTVSHKLIM